VGGFVLVRSVGVVLLVVGLGTPVSAEDPPRVHSVRIEASPEEQARLARYVELKPGDPLDPALLRHAVGLIYATGAYEDVRVESAETPDGVDLVVRPIPGPLLTEIRVTGDSAVSPADVRRIARLRLGEPLWSERLNAAAQAVALELADDGYLEALVTGEAVPAASGAVAEFHVSAGPRVHVYTVSIEGDATADELLSLARPRAGEIWHRAEAKAAADKMRRALVGRGYWRAAVYVDESYDPTSGTLTLAFRVDRGPMMAAEVRGLDVSGSVRSDVETILRDNAARSDALEESVDHLEEALRSSGHRQARVRTHEETSPARTVVVFEGTAGALAEVAQVRIDSAASLPIVSLATRVGQPVRDRDLDQDERTLSRLLQDRGYAEARVEADVPDGSGPLPVVFRVKAGARTEITAVEVRSPTALPAGGEKRELLTRVGRPYHPRDIVTDRNALAAAYRNGGYLSAEVHSELRFSEDRSELSVLFDVTPGPETRVDHVVISGLRHTHEDIVRRELRLKEGDPLGLEAVLESQRRLGSLGIFGNVSISEVDPESQAARSILVNVEERPLTGLAYSFGYSEQDHIRVSAEVTRRNLGGRDRSLSLLASAALKGGVRVFATYREPYLFGWHQEVFVTAFRQHEERVGFQYDRYGLQLETARRLSPKWSLIGRYAAQQTHDILDPNQAPVEIDRAFEDSTFSGPSLSLVYDTRDDPLDPRRGEFLGADGQLSAHALGGESFVKGFVQAAAYRRLTDHLLLALSGRIGLARTFGGDPDLLSRPDRFFAGGDYSLRGFELDRVGPLALSTAGTLVPTGGNAMVLGTVELRQDIGRYFGVALFSDSGNVYTLVSDLTLDDIRYAAGLGLRYRSAFGPIRVDWGYKLNRRSGESASRLAVAIGHAF
jgi:outer membrane protein assembly complex protein YaeT